MSNKSQRKYRAIETMEQGITAYLMINSLLDMYSGEEHPHIKLAKFVAKATLNELLYTYTEKNSNEQLQALIQRLNEEASLEGGDSPQVGEPAIPSV
jgi:hypothetical protein